MLNSQCSNLEGELGLLRNYSWVLRNRIVLYAVKFMVDPKGPVGAENPWRASPQSITDGALGVVCDFVGEEGAPLNIQNPSHILS